jgi:hypothetical protein
LVLFFDSFCGFHHGDIKQCTLLEFNDGATGPCTGSEGVENEREGRIE